MDCEPELRVRVVAARPDDCSLGPSLKRHRHEHRLAYRVLEDDLVILQARNH
jgi:hypothetical protein